MLETLAAVAPFVSLTALAIALGMSWLQSLFIKRLTTEYGKAEFAAYAICEMENMDYVQMLGTLVDIRQVLDAPIELREVNDALRG